jgi:hypothetical protein
MVLRQLIAQSGFDPPTFVLPIRCYNHYTNRGALKRQQSRCYQLDTAYSHIVMVIAQREQNRLIGISIRIIQL